MVRNEKRDALFGTGFLVAFALWTMLIQIIDVQSIGPHGSKVGFATINAAFHNLSGVHMMLYTITDWLGLVPIFICMGFAALGLKQWISRRSILRVDGDILLLGVYYIIVILAYLFFEMVPINYRPVLIDGVLEASYPSSTTLLVMSVMPTLRFQTEYRINRALIRRAFCMFADVFTLLMVLGRLVSGVHWLTDIAGSVMLSAGLFLLYRAGAMMLQKGMRSQRR